ncbi:HAD hydrolase family protein [uncultured Tateyamaria sp.]|uniref:HAD hydrolase family protein n=1 Tax=uncultured Tateyamaria sp. TaxID=455651 RepID=UPI0026042CD2|nr:HAD hydrolase family protein [uncultured Tateyamaria sp.]
MRTRFSTKLDNLTSTIDLCVNADVTALSKEISSGKDRPAVLVGSGGSAVSAEYFRCCRQTCSFGQTSVETPMKFVSDFSGLGGCDVWLLTAGAENADVMAAVQSAFRRGAAQVFMITRNPEGRAALQLMKLGGQVFSVPVSDEKDGFLATHSLVATITTLLLAFDALVDAPFGKELAVRFSDAVRNELSVEARERHRNSFSELKADDTLIVLNEPQLSPISTLIDTSVWEAAICNVQSTDFRNFAHGRHTWLHHRPDNSFLLALTGSDWNPVNTSVLSRVPRNIRRSVVGFGNCGRFENAVGIVKGLALIEAMGCAVEIDPGKPGVGSFGRCIYDDESLLHASTPHTSATRHKYTSARKQDTPFISATQFLDVHADRLEFLQGAIFGAVILDYDGTVVSTENRYDPPTNDIIEQLLRLRELGVLIAIATGRGGSVGEELRCIFDFDAQKDILVGYYNGAYLQSLDVDIDVHRPDVSPDISKAIDWMVQNDHLFDHFEKPKLGLQVTIQMDNLVSPGEFELAIKEFLPSVSNRLRLERSAHSYDLVVADASKLNVVKAVELQIPDDTIALRLGDSGSILGNDYDLLSFPSGISVDAVCCGVDGSWSLFGHEYSGPAALLKVLASLTPCANGGVRFAEDALELDN